MRRFPMWPAAATFALAILGGAAAAVGPFEEITIDGRSSAEWRRYLVDVLLTQQGIRDDAVLRAMRTVPRHVFVPPAWRDKSYRDHPLPIGEDQTISQPYIVAYMTQLAQVRPGMKVLEIGTGSGYQAAVLGELGAEIYTIEIVESLGIKARALLKDLGYENIHVRIGDGYRGWPDHAPFDAILVTAAPERVPQPLIDQLAVGGRMVIPVGEQRQWLRIITKTPDGTHSRQDLPVRFVPMTGEAQEE